MLPIAILAGGLGTRLWPETDHLPKALVKVCGRPFIDHQLLLMQTQGIQRVVLCISHLGRLIEDHVKDGSAFGLDVSYSYDGDVRLGTAGALKRALHLLGDEFFVTYGDSYLNCDYANVASIFQKSKKSGLMTVYQNDNTLVPSNVLFERDSILAYDKQTPLPTMRHVDFGLSAFRKNALIEVEETKSTDLAEVFQRLVARNDLAGFESRHRFFEVGTRDGISQLEAFLALPNKEDESAY